MSAYRSIGKKHGTNFGMPSTNSPPMSGTSVQGKDGKEPWTSDSPILRATALLLEVQQSKTLKDRAAWAILHVEQLSTCIRDLVAYHAGYRSEHVELVKLAGKLLDAIAPLLSANRVGGRHLLDDFVTGTAPRLQPAYDELKRYVTGEK
jgi:hypothetical protein